MRLEFGNSDDQPVLEAHGMICVWIGHDGGTRTSASKSCHSRQKH